MTRLAAIVGPTGVGKSRLAVLLAQKIPAEVVSADSLQVYRHMDIGTAKPTPEDMALVPHHLIDVADPDEDFSLARYQDMAYKAIASIAQRGKLPLLVGGSGQYVRSVVEGWLIPHVPPDSTYRASLEERAAGGGEGELYNELRSADPASAERIGRHNLRRIIRALEIYHTTGTPPSQMRDRKCPLFETLIIGLTAPREELYRLTDTRVDAMIASGLVDEVRCLRSMGYGPELSPMSSIGYKQAGLYLEGKLTLAAATAEMKTETHRVIRHQYSWFNLTDKKIRWFDIMKGNLIHEVEAVVNSFTHGTV